MKKFILSLLFICHSLLSAEIVEVLSAKEIAPFVESDSLVLLDIDETLFQFSHVLGRNPWCSVVRKPLKELTSKNGYNLYDLLVYYLVDQVPLKPVDAEFSDWIGHWQRQNISVLGFTARGFAQWYTTEIAGINGLTQTQLKTVNIHFEKSPLPLPFAAWNSPFFDEGIVYSCHRPKGPFLKEILTELDYHPQKVIFVDDKLEQVVSVNQALEEMGVPCIAIWFRKAHIDNLADDPMVGNIQFENLVFSNTLLDDETAASLIAEKEDPLKYFLNVLDRIDLDYFESTLRFP